MHPAPTWNPLSRRWQSPGRFDPTAARAIVERHAPQGAFPNGDRGAAGMVAALCPLEQLATLAPDDLKRKLAEVRFRHKASTPDDDDEYWLARSPFDERWYLFASTSFGGGWPKSPVHVGERPVWFDDE